MDFKNLATNGALAMARGSCQDCATEKPAETVSDESLPKKARRSSSSSDEGPSDSSDEEATAESAEPEPRPG